MHMYIYIYPAGKRVAFAPCKDISCPGGGIILFWATSTDCKFCAHPIKEGTLSYSLETEGGGEWVPLLCCLLSVYTTTQTTHRLLPVPASSSVSPP